VTLDVVIVGAGLSGLAAARSLTRAGRSVSVIDASESVGGRIKTSNVDGFLLDHGFQVYLTGYELAAKQLDLDALGLQCFAAGARVRIGHRWSLVTDPLRSPGNKRLSHAVQTALSPVASLADKWHLWRFRRALVKQTAQELLNHEGGASIDRLKSFGFSDRVIDRFFRPVLGGIFLDRSLSTASSRMEFVFRAFSIGLAALPREGMQAIPAQIASDLPAGVLRLNTTAAGIEQGCLVLSDGTRVNARLILIATEESAAARLLQSVDVGCTARPGTSTTNVVFAADRAPTREPILFLNGNSFGRVHHVAFPSLVQPSYAPLGEHLVSVNIVGKPDLMGDALVSAVQAEMVDWFGWEAGLWRHLRTFHVPYSLPDQSVDANRSRSHEAQKASGVFVCGDYCETGSIEGAIQSGITVAERIDATLG